MSRFKEDSSPLLRKATWSFESSLPVVLKISRAKQMSCAISDRCSSRLFQTSMIPKSDSSFAEIAAQNCHPHGFDFHLGNCRSRASLIGLRVRRVLRGTRRAFPVQWLTSTPKCWFRTWGLRRSGLLCHLSRIFCFKGVSGILFWVPATVTPTILLKPTDAPRVSHLHVNSLVPSSLRRSP